MGKQITSLIVLLFCCLLLLWVVPATADQTPKQDPLESIARDFVICLVNQQFEKAVGSFDDTMKNLLPPEKLKEVWNSILTQFDQFEKQLDVRIEIMDNYKAVSVECQFEKAVVALQIAINNSNQITGFHITPVRQRTEEKPLTQANTDSFIEKEIQLGSGQLALPGTLTLPNNQGPFPALILVHGSGPHDRDESVGPNKPFRDLAWGLAAKGVAVLRYEKRTKALPLSLPLNAITVKEETINDALAAVDVLRKTDGIEPNNVFILGHSLGGFVIPRIGKLNPQIAGFIVMAGSARPLEEVILEQFTYIFSLDGIIENDEKTNLEKLKKQVMKVNDPVLAADTPATDLPLGIPATYWLDLRGYQPAEMAKELSQRILIIQGGRDYQVTNADFQLWKKALTSRKNVEFKLYEKLNHLFIEGEGKSTPMEYEISGHVDQTVINDIADWIKKS